MDVPPLRRAWQLGGLVAGGMTSVVWAAMAWSERLPSAPPIIVDAVYDTRIDTLHRDEPVAAVLVRRGVPWAEVQQVIDAAAVLNPRRVRAGQIFDFRYPLNESRPQRVATRLDDERILHLRRLGDGSWQGVMERIGWHMDQREIHGAIGTSLYDALHAAVPDSVLPGPEVDRFISDLADEVFGWEVDFSRDVLSGDAFSLVFQRLSSSLGEVRYGRLVAARIDTRGTEHRAYLVSGDGRHRYYDEHGISLQRAFKKNPVAYLRISSRFSSRRMHPVLGTWRAHRGTDYKAHTGTEIHATGDGVVRVAGRNGGYGLMVSVRHPRGIETRYAHMSRIKAGIRPGAPVKQGQVIGYVGATGLANGPHVHYEFLKNGRQVNPQAADLGDGSPLPEAHRAEFEAVKSRYARLLAPAESARPVAN